MRPILALPMLLFTIPTMKQLSALPALSIFLPVPTLAEEPLEEKRAAWSDQWRDRPGHRTLPSHIILPRKGNVR